MKAAKGLVCGVGINDSFTEVTKKKRVSGKFIIIWSCPFYARWKGMLRRCYSPVEQARNPTYVGCAVCDDWLVFSKFRKWMQEQDWQGKHLDKDLLCRGNRIYSPDKCIFIDPIVNGFILDAKKSRGALPIGVSICCNTGKFRSQCSNPITRKNEYLGVHDSAQIAHQHWLKRKTELAAIISDMQECKVVKDGLNSFFSEYKTL